MCVCVSVCASVCVRVCACVCMCGCGRGMCLRFTYYCLFLYFVNTKYSVILRYLVIFGVIWCYLMLSDDISSHPVILLFISCQLA